jgi:hypothetical protein
MILEIHPDAADEATDTTLSQLTQTYEHRNPASKDHIIT